MERSLPDARMLARMTDYLRKGNVMAFIKHDTIYVNPRGMEITSPRGIERNSVHERMHAYNPELFARFGPQGGPDDSPLLDEAFAVYFSNRLVYQHEHPGASEADIARALQERFLNKAKAWRYFMGVSAANLRKGVQYVYVPEIITGLVREHGLEQGMRIALSRTYDYSERSLARAEKGRPHP